MIKETNSISKIMNPDHLLWTFHICMESSDDGFIFVNTDGNIVYINKAYCQYIGVERDQVIGKPVLDYIETSQLVKAANDPTFVTQANVLHKVSEKQYRDREPYSIVNRANVSIDGVPIAGVGQIKFVRSTLRLSAAIKNAYDELSYYKNEVSRLGQERYTFKSIVGTAPIIQNAKKTALRAAKNDFPVLITGETGTGKEVFANVIHYISNRKTKPFIRINCAAIPSDLLESELFGHEEGAFTGSRKGGKKGKFELADGGTLFLDEIGDMPLPMQAKILRALQEGEIEHVGSEKSISVNVRIIAATNRKLEQEISEKRFRADLYYRLNVIVLSIPPLRERKEDISIFIDLFLSEINQKYHTDVRITDKAREILINYSWPGNVRELKNIIERCYTLSDNEQITHLIIPHSIIGPSLTQNFCASGKPLDAMLDEIEREILITTINKHNCNLRQTAISLGIHRTTLYKKMEKHGITRSDFK